MKTGPFLSPNSIFHSNPLDIIAEYKLLLVGDSGVGKTTFVKKHRTGEFENRHIPTTCVQSSSKVFSTNYGYIKFNIWDIAGREDLRKLREFYYFGADCAIIMLDVTSETSAKNVPRWFQDLRRICPVPVVVVGNKVDKRNRKVKARHVTEMIKNGLRYYDYSNKTEYQFEKPFLYLMRRLMNEAGLNYMALTPISPALSKNNICSFDPLSIVAEFKLLLVGDSGVGKTTFVKKHITGEFEDQHVPTKGVEVSSIVFSTNYGYIQFNIWDIAGLETLRELKEGYYIGADCAIIMLDVTSRRSAKNVPRWYKDVMRICARIPVVVLGNQVEKRNRKFKAKHVTHMTKNELQYYDYSNKTGYQFEKPFLFLMMRLVNDIGLKNVPFERDVAIDRKIRRSRMGYLVLILSIIFMIVAYAFLKRSFRG